MNHKHEALWPLKRCTLYILCTLILSNCLHLTIGSSLTLIQNKLWVPKCCLAHFKVFFFLCLGFPENAIKILVYCTPIILVIHHFFGWKVVENGGKWLIHSVLSPSCERSMYLKFECNVTSRFGLLMTSCAWSWHPKRWWYNTIDQYFYSIKKQVWYVWQNHSFYAKVPIKQLFDMAFYFLGCYKVDHKIMLKILNLHNECLGKDPMV
jgi:hypothetical protein